MNDDRRNLRDPRTKGSVKTARNVDGANFVEIITGFVQIDLPKTSTTVRPGDKYPIVETVASRGISSAENLDKGTDRKN